MQPLESAPEYKQYSLYSEVYKGVLHFDETPVSLDSRTYRGYGRHVDLEKAYWRSFFLDSYKDERVWEKIVCH